jgi:hypothetical protein
MVPQSKIIEAVAAETLVLVEDQQTEFEIKKILDTRFTAERNKLIFRTLDYFANSYQVQFFAAGKKAGFLMEAPKMNVFTAIAFQQSTNVSLEQLRIINRYLTKTIGSRIMPSERAIKAEVPDDNPPEIIETELEGIKYKWFVKSFPHVISSRVSKKLSKPWNRELDGNHLVSADIIYSGDHGQRTFKLGFKVILHFENGETVEAVETLGDMVCKKDSYKVLMETMGLAMNDGLQKLLKADKKQGKDWYISLDDEIVNIEIPQTEEEIAAADRAEAKKKVTTRVRITGDLAFYAIMLGKVNMDSKWCNWCKFYCNQDWNFGDDAGFEMWTKASIAEWYSKVLIDGQLRKPKMNSRDRCGVVAKPILDVCPSIFIIPPLHLKLGLFNTAIIKPTKGKSFFQWLEVRVEKASNDEIDTRDQWLEKLQDLPLVEQELTTWDESFKKVDMEHYYCSWKELIEELTYTQRSGRWSREERAIMEIEKKESKAAYDELNKQRTDLVEVVANDKRICAAIKKRYESLQSKRTWRSRLVKRTVEAILRKHGIERAAYHGGDLTGAHIQSFCNRASVIFMEIEEKLLDIHNAEGYEGLADANEIKDVCGRFRTLVVLMDGFFSLHMMKHKEFHEMGEALARVKAQKYVIALQKTWRSLCLSTKGPKYHSLSHFVDQFMAHNGIGAFHEEWIEVMHRSGNHDNRRVGMMKDVGKQATYVSRLRAAFDVSEVIKMKQEFCPPRIRKRNERQQEQKEEDRAQVLEAITQQFSDGGEISTIHNYFLKRRIIFTDDDG